MARLLPRTARGRYALVLVLFVALTSIFFIHLVTDLGGRILWNLSDASNGVRLYWATAHAGTNPYEFQRDYLNGAPEGLPVPSAPNIAAPVQAAVIWVLMPVLGILAAFNLYMLAGFVLTGLAVFVLLDRLGIHPLASFFAAYVVTFNPWMIYKARDGQPGFTQGWALVLVVGASIWLVRSRSLRAAACLGLSVGICFWIASYWGLFASVIAAVALLVDLVVARPVSEKLWTFTLATIAVAITGAFLIPGAVAYLTHKSTVNMALDNPFSELQNCAARAASYLLPASGHPVCGSLAQDLSGLRQGGQDEQTLFFGYTTYLLAGFALITRFRRKLMITPKQDAGVRFLGTLAPVAIYFSLPRIFHLAGIGIPAASYFVSHVTNFYRCYARFGFVFGIAAALLAAIALNHLIVRYRRRGTAIAVAATLLVAFELLYGPINAWQANNPPAYVRWLAKQPQGTVASYPAPTDQIASLVMAQREYYWQIFDDHALFTLFGSGWGGTREQGIRVLARYVTDPLTPGILAAEHVRYVLLHDDVYRGIGESPPAVNPRQFRLVARFPNVRAYVLRKSVAPANLDQVLQENAVEVALVEGLNVPTVTYQGFGAPTKAGWRTAGQGATFTLHNSDVRLTRVQIVAHVATPKGGSTVQLVESNGAVAGQAEVGTQDTQVTFGPFSLPQGDTSFSLRVVPAGRSGSSILLGPILVQPVADFSTSIAAHAG